MNQNKSCSYCGVECDDEADLNKHMANAHDREELSRLDRRRVTQHTRERTMRPSRPIVFLTVGIVLSGVVLVLVSPGLQASLSITDSQSGPNPGDVRTATDSGNVFLGGDFFELGIRDGGEFGANPPSEFFGDDRGSIGMYADIDGFFNNTRDLRYDYFLPGTPEERWSVGYDGGNVASNGRSATNGIPSTTVTEASTADRAAVEVDSTYDGALEINQTYSFDPEDRFFRTTVTMTNIDSSTITDVRYQRSFDPDNGQDLGCAYATNNTVVSQQPTDDAALVQAAVQDPDPDGCRQSLANFDDDIPIFYYSEDDRVRVSAGATGGLTPTPVVYADEDYDNPQPGGTVVESDVYIALTFEETSLDPGESTTFTFFTALTDDVEGTVENIGASGEPAVAVNGTDITMTNTTIQGE